VYSFTHFLGSSIWNVTPTERSREQRTLRKAVGDFRRYEPEIMLVRVFSVEDCKGGPRRM